MVRRERTKRLGGASGGAGGWGESNPIRSHEGIYYHVHILKHIYTWYLSSRIHTSDSRQLEKNKAKEKAENARKYQKRKRIGKGEEKKRKQKMTQEKEKTRQVNKHDLGHFLLCPPLRYAVNTFRQLKMAGTPGYFVSNIEIRVRSHDEVDANGPPIDVTFNHVKRIPGMAYWWTWGVV